MPHEPLDRIVVNVYQHYYHLPLFFQADHTQGGSGHSQAAQIRKVYLFGSYSHDILLRRCSAITGKHTVLRSQQYYKQYRVTVHPFLSRSVESFRIFHFSLVGKISSRNIRHFCQIRTTSYLAHFGCIFRRPQPSAQPMRAPRPTVNVLVVH